jgi:hypothetical protein
MSAGTAQVLVLNATPTRLDTASKRFRSIEIQNNGPNNIWCAIGHEAPASLVLLQCRKVVPTEAWSLDLCSSLHVWALAETANQISGAATCVTEV